MQHIDNVNARSVLYAIGESCEVFGGLLQITVRPMRRDRCPVCSACNVGVLRPNGWTDQDTTWYGGRPRPRGHALWYASSPPTERGTAAPTFSAHVYFGPSIVAKRSPISCSNCWALVIDDWWLRATSQEYQFSFAQPNKWMMTVSE